MLFQVKHSYCVFCSSDRPRIWVQMASAHLGIMILTAKCWQHWNQEKSSSWQQVAANSQKMSKNAILVYFRLFSAEKQHFCYAKKKTDYFDVDNSGKIEQRFVNFSLLTFKTLIKFLCVLILVNFFTTR